MPRKLIALILIVFMLGLTACSPETVPIPISAEPDELTPGATQTSRVVTTPTTSTSVEVKSTPVPLGVKSEELHGVTLQFWHPWTHDLAYSVEALVDQFNAENAYGVRVNVSSQGNDLYLNVRNSVSSGLMPNVALAVNYQIHSWNNYGNVIQDLNIYIDDLNWGLKETEVIDFYPTLWEKAVNNGKRLSIPGYTTSTVIVYNKTWAEELGFNSYPVTPIEFKAQACAAAAASVNVVENNPTGGWIASLDPAIIMSWILAFGGDGINGGGDGYDFDTLEVKAAFEFIKSLFMSGCAWIPEDQYPDNDFATRRGLFYSTSITGFPYISSSFETNEWGDEWIAIPYPSLEREPVVNLVGLSYAIMQSTPEEQLAAWLFIQWMTQPENQARIIEAASSFPTRVSTLDNLVKYARENPQWATAQELIPNSFVEPQFGSWGVARWVISDAAASLIKSSFTREEIPLLIEQLNSTIAEVHFHNP
jgi:ABC-type glycerol-3-phosphate transport system substrate-binding protein